MVGVFPRGMRATGASSALCGAAKYIFILLNEFLRRFESYLSQWFIFPKCQVCTGECNVLSSVCIGYVPGYLGTAVRH